MPTDAEIWENWAKEDPLWGIMAAEDKRGNQWRLDEFMATGRKDVDEVLAQIQMIGATLAKDRALDFGCGVGRLTQALAREFARVDGVDQAKGYIQLAERHNAHQERVSYQVSGTELPFPDEQFDLVLSLITLHHIPPRQQLHFLSEFVRVARLNGLLVFQWLGFPLNLSGRLGAQLPRLLRLYHDFRYSTRQMPAYVVHPDSVREHLETRGVRVLRLSREHDHKAYASFNVVAQKVSP
jgi:SAM-dependent methyltransferase